MPWQTVTGIAGKVYVPETTEDGKKYPCSDCFACQNCSQERCLVCREGKPGRHCSCSPHKEAAP